MWGWFGGSSAEKKDAPKNAILALRSQLDMLSKREKHLQNQIDDQDAIARKNVSTNKNGTSGILPPRPVELLESQPKDGRHTDVEILRQS